MSQSHLHEVQKYLPAVVKQLPSVGTVVEYFVFDPTTELMSRKRIKLTRLVKRLPNQRQRMLAAQKVADDINAKLRGGWSPLHQTEDSRLYTPLPSLQEKFLTAKKAEGCRPTTLTQYKSVTDLWLRWCEDNGHADLYSGTYLRVHAVRYMDDAMERKQRNRSYNNTLKVMRAFFQWAMEHCYAKENPFLGMKTLKKEQKIRILVPKEAREKVAEFYSDTRPAMNIVCQLVYSSAVRPAEIAKIQLKHIHLDRHYIDIPSENAKNHKERFASLTPSLVELLQPIVECGKNLDLYLFGKNETLKPGREPVNKQYFQKSWDRMRTATGLPKEMQLYSLRDTGLIDLLHAGVDQLTVQHHADHSSLAIQNIYTDHYDSGVSTAIWEMAPRF